MRPKPDAAAIALVRAIATQTDTPLPRMQNRILHYLVERGYVGHCGLSRPELSAMASHFGRSTSLVRHEIVKLVEVGAVLRWMDEWKTLHFSFNPDWIPARSEEVSCPEP